MSHELIGRPCLLQPAHYMPGMAPMPQRMPGYIINQREPGIVRVRDRATGSTHDRVRLIEDGQQPPPLGLWCRLDK